MRERNERESLQRENEALLATLDEIDDAIQALQRNEVDGNSFASLVIDALQTQEVTGDEIHK